LQERRTAGSSKKKTHNIREQKHKYMYRVLQRPRSCTEGFGFVLLKEEEHHQGEDEEGDEAGDAARNDPQHRHLHTRLQELCLFDQNSQILL